MASIAIVGPGRMGLTLAAALAESRDFRSITVYGRHPEPPVHPTIADGSVRYVFGIEPLERDVIAVLLAVPDSVIPEMAFALAGHGLAPDACCAFHLSGSLPTDILEPLHHQGYAVGSFHPLVTIADALVDKERLDGAYVSVTGAPETVAVARRLTLATGSRLLTVPAARRALYHAGVAMASTFVLPLLARSAHLMERAGVPGDDALLALLPLIRGTLDSVERGGVPDAVHGPIARGDVETVALHLRALDVEDQRLYSLLGLEVLRLAEPAMGPEAHGAMADLFSRYVELETTGTGY